MSKRKYYVAIGGCVIVLLLVANSCTSAKNTTAFVSTTSSTLAERTTTMMPNSNEEDLQRARAALSKFFTLLHEGAYGEATKYYGGSYEVLQNWNPPVNKNDHAALLEAGCKSQLGCFLVRKIIREKQLSQDTFGFAVELTASDGDLYVRGPLPGQTKDQAISHFNYVVRKAGDRFLVQSLPPTIP
ncbi:MAG: hypothetical protein ACYC56_11405 [Candidatus Aquicultor sp.]